MIDAATVPLGPFTLLEPIGAGGMAEVWRARHRASGELVAVKVITAGRAEDPRFLSGFHREVQAMAALRHPDITAVVDYGTIEAESAHASDGRLRAGSPFFVMELADGSLSAEIEKQCLTWPDVRRVLVSLMDALAHAHARGVVHLDIKPDNVLTFRTETGVRFKLADFGIAHSMTDEAPATANGVVGTVHYMAPEQLLGHWRDFTAATDLYALGCLAWVLVSGGPPFQGQFRDIVIQHLRATPPPLLARTALPLGFEAWAHRLLQKRGISRYRRAADAKRELLSLGDADQSHLVVVPASIAPVTVPPDIDSSDTLHGAEVSIRDSISDDDFANDETADSRAEPAGALRNVPADWRENAPLAQGQLVGVSTHLYRLRSIPIVGRETERDRLWGALRRSVRERCARVVVLQGASGSGKSSLAEWLCHRAHELGVASTLRATHFESGGPATGLVPMIVRYLRCGGLNEDEMDARVAQMLAMFDVPEGWTTTMLRRMLRETAGEATTSAEPLSPEARAAVVKHFLDGVAQLRPCVAWLDDVQWGEASVHVLSAMLSGRESIPAPVLLVATVQDEAVAERPEVAKAIDDLAHMPGCERIRLESLTDHEMTSLLSELLRLDESTARRVTATVDGNPLFAVQLVGDWAERGNLVLVGDQLHLKRDVEATLPDDLHQVWAARLERLLARRGSADRRAVEAAAALGLEVEDAEWRGLCSRLGVTPEGDLVASLVSQGLGVYRETGWTFVHAMLRESLVRILREQGRLNELQHATAEHLSALHRESPQRGLLGRIGRMWFECGESERALAPLRHGAEERAAMGELHAALELLDLAEQASLTSEGARGRETTLVALTRVPVLLQAAQLDTAQELAQHAEHEAKSGGWDDMLARCLAERSDIESHRGRFREALSLAQQSLVLCERVQSDAGTARALQRIADACAYMGMHEMALENYFASRELHLQLRDRSGVAYDDWGLGYVRLQRLQLDEAALHLESGHRALTGAGGSALAFRIQATLGDLDRIRGNLDDAREKHREALRFYEATGDVKRIVSYLNLGHVDYLRGDIASSERWCARAEAALEESAVEYLWAGLRTLLLMGAAARQRWDEWDDHMRRLPALYDESGVVEVDDALMVEVAAEDACDASQPARAASAYALSGELWRRLQFPDRAAAAEKRRATLQERSSPA